MSADFKQSANLAGKILASGCVNPTYTVSFAGVPTGGTFTPTITTGVNGTSPNVQSVAITYTATLTAAAVQTAVQALTGMSTVTVSGSNGGPFTFTIPTALGVGTVTVASALTGGTAPLAAVTTNGVDATVYTVPASSAVKLGTFSITTATAVASTLSVSVVPSGGSLDGTHRVISAYPFGTAGTDAICQDDVLGVVKGAALDTGAVVSINCTQPVTYLLTGWVAS